MTFDATLKLYDGTPLAGRLVDFTYTATGNSQLAAQGAQPAGTTRTSTGATDKTDAAGVVSVAIADPASPQAAELDNTLTATTADDPDNKADGNDDPDETGSLDVDFGITTPPPGTTNVAVVLGDNSGSNKPGVASDTSTVTVTGDPDGTGPKAAGPIAGIAVTLTVDNEGFFTNGAPDPAKAAGNDTGELKSLGTTITVVTDNKGVAQVPAVAMERNEDFDVDGRAEAIVKATVTTTSDTEDYDFDSSNPLNGGSVELVQVAGRTDGPTRVDNYIKYDVRATDQFGNLVGDERVALSENGPHAFLDSASTVWTDFDNDPDVWLISEVADSGKLTATWDAPFSEYGAAPTYTPVTGNRKLTDTADFAFYEVDFNASMFTITTSPEGPVPVGTAVTETVKVVDQEGQPVQYLAVEFIRSGPGQQDGDPNVERETNRNGEAFYSFTGTEAGDAQISAVISDGIGNKVLTDTVTFVGTDPEPTPEPTPEPAPMDIIAKLKAPNNGGQADELKIVTSGQGIAKGAVVRLFKVVKGNKRLVGRAKLNGRGKASFTKADRNGNGKTKYFATIGKTAKSNTARTNTRNVS